MNIFLIRHPVVTEKATALAALGQYVFLVHKNATAPAMKHAIKARYHVNAVRVNFINVKPKARRLGRTIGRKPGYRKAIVTLKAGEKLDILPK